MDGILEYYYAPLKFVCAFFAFLVTKRFLPVRPGIVWQILLYGIHLITADSFVYIGETLPLAWMAAGFLAGICLFCSGRLIARLSIGLILFSVSIALDALVSNIPPPMDQFRPMFSLTFWLVTWLVVRKALPKGAPPVIESSRLWLLLDLLAVMPVGSVLTVVGLTVTEKANVHPNPFYDENIIPNEQVLLVVLVLAVVSAIGLMVAVVVLARHEKLEQEQALARMRSQYYSELEEWQGQVRHLRHDMANHLTAMSGLSDAAMRSYLSDLIASPAMAAPRRYCENGVVNSVLSSKQHTSEANHIKTDFNLKIPQAIPVAETDLCALFANSLDNAIEACLKLPEGERHISLHANTIGGMFMYRIENNMAGQLEIKGGRIATTKKDDTNHGFGLRGIKNIAERYNGTMQAEQVGHKFQLTVSLCI